MDKFYNKVLIALQKEDKEEAVSLCVQALENKGMTVVDLYTNILTPALANIIDEYEQSEDLIWREHVRSGIVRTIIELSYPYILQERKYSNGEKVLVVCPEFEEHELGARMVADFFRLEGFDTTFVGARTPVKTLLQALEIVKPNYLIISVTNFYNLVSVKKMIAEIKEASSHELTFIIGGRAINANRDVVKFVGADLSLEGYTDIQKLSEEAH